VNNVDKLLVNARNRIRCLFGNGDYRGIESGLS
jgi:hypothetical protein